MSNTSNITPSLSGFLRLSQIVGSKDRPALIPIAKSTWWAGIRAGRYPAGVKLSPRVTVWRAEDIRALIEGAAA